MSNWSLGSAFRAQNVCKLARTPTKYSLPWNVTHKIHLSSYALNYIFQISFFFAISKHTQMNWKVIDKINIFTKVLFHTNLESVNIIDWFYFIWKLIPYVWTWDFYTKFGYIKSVFGFTELVFLSGIISMLGFFKEILKYWRK